MRDKRIFIAIDISATARQVCKSHIDTLRHAFPGVRVGWERPEKLHITLKFLGDVPDELLGAITTETSGVASRYEPFKLRMSTPGVFPGRSSPRILWLGVEDVSNASSAIYKDLDNVCGGLGFKTDSRKFHPHVTIGRVREPENARPLTEVHLQKEIEPVEFEVSEIVVYESKLQPTGSVYSVASRATLGGR